MAAAAFATSIPAVRSMVQGKRLDSLVLVHFLLGLAVACFVLTMLRSQGLASRSCTSGAGYTWWGVLEDTRSVAVFIVAAYAFLTKETGKSSPLELILTAAEEGQGWPKGNILACFL